MRVISTGWNWLSEQYIVYYEKYFLFLQFWSKLQIGLESLFIYVQAFTNLYPLRKCYIPISISYITSSYVTFDWYSVYIEALCI